MRKCFPWIVLAVWVMACSGCAMTHRSVPATTEDARLEVRVYEVFGMDCPGCHGGLEKLVLRIPAVEAAEANWVEKRLTVTLRSGSELDDDEVHKAIREANFTVGKRLQ